MLLLEYIKPHPSGYLVSNCGRVMSPSGKELKQRVNYKGYRMVTLHPFRGMCVHRLVAETFVDNPMPLFYKCVNHKSEWRYSCRADDLEWCDYSYNNTYNGVAKRRGLRQRGKRGKQVVLSKGGATKSFSSYGEADRFLGRRHKMHEAIKDKHKSVYGWQIVAVGNEPYVRRQSRDDWRRPKTAYDMDGASFDDFQQYTELCEAIKDLLPTPQSRYFQPPLKGESPPREVN